MSTEHVRFENIPWNRDREKEGVLFKDVIVNEHGFNIRYFKLEPNAQIPRHNHSVREYDEVLYGTIADETGIYQQRDTVVNEAGSEHSMKAGPRGCEFLVLWIEK